MEDTLEQNAQSGSEGIAEMTAFFAELGKLVEVEEQKERQAIKNMREFFHTFGEMVQKENEMQNTCK